MIVVARKYEYAPEAPRPDRIKKRDWIWIGTSIAAIIVLILILRVGAAPSGEGLRMGWAESNTKNHWSAAYAFHDGYQQRTINTGGDPTSLEIEIVSSSGDIGITVLDENGTIIYERESIGTSSFDIAIPGKVTVRIIGEEHQGSFSLSW